MEIPPKGSSRSAALAWAPGLAAWHSCSMENPRSRIVAIPHGGGPLPIMGDPSHGSLISFLKETPALFGRPKAIVLISAHWETPQPAITAGASPGMIYDYGGFPPETYELQYPAPGSPELATELADLLRAGGFDPTLDADRGFDHGVYVPLLLMYPDATIPVVQLSVLSSLDPAAHVAMGQAISSLADQDVLILGSGFTFHNLNAFSPGSAPGAEDPQNEAFEAWLRDTCSDPALTSDQREERFVNWATAPGARWCHPREEHLLPLHVCAGAAQLKPADIIFDDLVLNKRASGYSWSA